MRLIDADALKAKYEQMLPEIGDGYHKETLQDVLFELEYAPTISPDEVRGVGKWDRVETEFGLRCPKCGKLLDEYVNGGEWVALSEIPNYCPNCGARMGGVQDALS